MKHRRIRFVKASALVIAKAFMAMDYAAIVMFVRRLVSLLQ